jgi:hypothetical protein
MYSGKIAVSPGGGGIVKDKIAGKRKTNNKILLVRIKTKKTLEAIYFYNKGIIRLYSSYEESKATMTKM